MTQHMNSANKNIIAIFIGTIHVLWKGEMPTYCWYVSIHTRADIVM